jgi:very-short-patch-repair endonuclease
MPDLTLKQIAEMKKDFLESDFGKLAAKKITELHGQMHEKAEQSDDPATQSRELNKAAGVSEVIRFFTADVALLEQGYFDEEAATKP